MPFPSAAPTQAHRPSHSHVQLDRDSGQGCRGLLAVHAPEQPLPHGHGCSSKVCVRVVLMLANCSIFFNQLLNNEDITVSLFIFKGPVWSQIDLCTSYCLDRYSKVTTSPVYWCMCFIMHLIVLFLCNEWVLQWEINWNASLGINQCTYAASIMGSSCSVVKVFFWNGLAALCYRRSWLS